jgi:hypothetical protein
LSSYSKVITEVTTEMPRLYTIFLRLDFAGKLNGAAEQQQFFGERGLTGIRVRDNSECAAAGDRLG